MRKSKETKTRRKISARKVLAGSVVFIVLFALLFICRGWLRMTVIPKTIKTIQGNSIKKVYDNEVNRLQNPFVLVGYTSPGDITNTCVTILANGLSTQVFCQYGIVTHSFKDRASLTNDKMNANAEKLQALLDQNGWQIDNSGYKPAVSLKNLVATTTAGTEIQLDSTRSQFDNTYEKKVGQAVCRFHSNAISAAPSPPLFDTQIYCYRINNILGTPSYE